MKSEDRPNLTGRRFGKLVAHEFVFGGGGWRCVCDCGKERHIYTANLVNGMNQSCGCLSKIKIKRTRHGMSRWPEYQIWTQAKRRVSDPTHKDYPDYGGRGIGMKKEWFDAFPEFIAGVKRRPRAGYWLDRIDNDKGYEPGNMAWRTPTDQQRNKRSNHLYSIRGKLMTIREAFEKFGAPKIGFYAVKSRVSKGFDIETALRKPLRYA